MFYFLGVNTQKCDDWILWDLFLIFWAFSIFLSIVTVPIYIPTNHVQVFSFLHSHSNTSKWLFSKRNKLQWYLYYFDFHLPNERWWISCHEPLGHLYVFGECLLRSSAHFFNQALCFCYWIYEVFLFILDINNLSDKCANIFSHLLVCLKFLVQVSYCVTF